MKNKEHYDLRKIKYRIRRAEDALWHFEIFEGPIQESNKIGDMVKKEHIDEWNPLLTWLEAEFKPQINAGEEIILRNLDYKYGFIYRDNSGILFVSSFKISPYDDEEESLTSLEPFSHLFKFIKRNETYSIAELLLRKPKSLYNKIEDDVYLGILTITDFEVSVRKLLSNLFLNVNNKKQRKIIVDMALNTGLNEYRFLEYDVADDGKIILDSSKTADLREDLISLANSFIQKEKDVLKNSMLSAADRERILNN